MTTKLIINCTTGERTEVELTAEEVAQREANALLFAEQEAAWQAEVDAKAQAKASAQAKLKVLGLTDAEVASL
jgi:hypothetical protein